MKTCSKCNIQQPLVEFTANKNTKDKLECWCKTCKAEYRLKNKQRIKQTNKEAYFKNKEERLVYQKQHYLNNCEKIKQYTAEWRKQNFEYTQDKDLIRKHGISLKSKKQMIIDQNNKCLICENEFVESRKTHVDHNHTTGKIRGILCHGCNTGLGLFKESKEYLTKAIRYLETHN